MSTIHLKSADELSVMREAGRIVARAHAAMREALRPGITTGELDAIAEAVIRDHNATPAFLNYPKADGPPFPGSITASINAELVHGIPSFDRVLEDGDIISLDTGCHYEGFVGDAAVTLPVGDVSPAVRRLLTVTERALHVGIKASVLGKETKHVANAIQKYVEGQGYAVAKGYTGHGVGRNMHEEPAMPNWWGRQANDLYGSYPLEVGMVYAIEPMVMTGDEATEELGDQWTVVTKDRSLCAHFEHTIAITDGEPMILTLP
ncbi:MAG: type I methionyl aminopeptidase [Chloroflexota bacterium]